MPIIVDKEEVRMDILLAFQRCIEKKPIDKVTLRDIAAEAGMSHPKLLNYFESKDALILSYVKYTREYMSKHCMEWFKAHSRKDYESNLAYMNAFMKYVADAPEGELRPNATTQTYVLGHYNDEIGRMICDEFRGTGKVPCLDLRRGGRKKRGGGDDDTHCRDIHLQLQQSADRADKRQHHRQHRRACPVVKQTEASGSSLNMGTSGGLLCAAKRAGRNSTDSFP